MFCAPVLSNSWLSWLSVLTGKRGYEIVVQTWIFTEKVKIGCRIFRNRAGDFL